MVGVRGKYKGCETCRARRVKCDNERPFCRKCIDSGRECAGYEREMVFITATIDDAGRCSSHPPRQVQSTTRRSGRSQTVEEEVPRLTPTEPLTPAWDDLISLSDNGIVYAVQFAALHTKLQNIVRGPQGQSQVRFRMALPTYSPVDLETWDNGSDADLNAQGMISLLPTGDVNGSPEGICAFLFEQSTSSLVTNGTTPWGIPQGHLDAVKRLGPTYFRQFPAHHFFVRVHRCSAEIILALLHRRSTFLSSVEWCTIPWELHPKTLFDRLFDIIALLPGIFARVDRTIAFPATLQRRLKAQELLESCLQLEKRLEEWDFFARAPTAEHPYAYWIEQPDDPDAQQIPFADNLAFKDGISSVTFLYHWMALLLLHRCIESLHHTIFQPVIEDFPHMYPDLPSHLQINLARYQQRREFASRICRALDFALSTTVQPDLLAAPLTVALEHYREINTSSRDGELEIMWCENFRSRLTSKGQDIVNVLQSRSWADIGKF